VSAKK